MNRVYLSLGSNEGNRTEWLNLCLQMLKAHCGNITATSNIYETAAWGLPNQPDFLNMAVCLDSELSETEILTQIRFIEETLKRQRAIKWGQRTLDIDILFFNDTIINNPELHIPHPYLQERRFVLVPLNDIAADLVHPVLKKTVAKLLMDCPDPLPVNKFEATQ
jgi:2-amino-4-hydroxy-6-hydroxymethyldihydropteridine diphosphokinase